MARTRSFGVCGVKLAVDELSTGIFRVKCPRRPGIVALTRATEEESVIENICGFCPKKPKSSFLGPEPWTGPDGNDYLIYPDGRSELLKGR